MAHRRRRERERQWGAKGSLFTSTTADEKKKENQQSAPEVSGLLWKRTDSRQRI